AGRARGGGADDRHARRARAGPATALAQRLRAEPDRGRRDLTKSTEERGTNMTTLAHTRSGTGPPLVLLHGIGLSRRSWDPVLPALTARFDVIAVDLPGFGESAPLNEQAVDEQSEV